MKLDITTLFDSALIMFIPVLAGIAAARLGYFKDGFSKKLSAFVLNRQPGRRIKPEFLSVDAQRNDAVRYFKSFGISCCHVVPPSFVLLFTVSPCTSMWCSLRVPENLFVTDTAVIASSGGTAASEKP